jgi:hypothetical protein
MVTQSISAISGYNAGYRLMGHSTIYIAPPFHSLLLAKKIL